MTNKVHPDSVEPQYIKGTNTLENLLKISDSSLLLSKETDITAIRSSEILANHEVAQPYTFDFNHLRAIHKHLFQDIFSWAGKPRSYDMAKSGNVFTPATDLQKYEAIVFEPSLKLADLALQQKIPTKTDLANDLSKSLGLINQFHPFPEGNGRTQRLFISSLASEFGYSVDWSEVANWEMIEVCKRVHEGNYEPMNALIHRILKNNSPRS